MIGAISSTGTSLYNVVYVIWVSWGKKYVNQKVKITGAWDRRHGTGPYLSLTAYAGVFMKSLNKDAVAYSIEGNVCELHYLERVLWHLLQTLMDRH